MNRSSLRYFFSKPWLFIRQVKSIRRRPYTKKIILLQPWQAEVLRLLGTAEYQLGNFGECVKYLSKSVSINPNQPETHFNLAVALSGLKRHEEAVSYYNKAVVQKTNCAEAYFNRGVALIEIDRTEDAVEDFNRAVAIKPNYAKAYFNLGFAQRKLGRDDEAIASYDRAIEILPHYAEAYYNKGNVLADQNKPLEALVCYERALEIKPDYADVHYNKGILLAQIRRLEEALVCYDKALQVKPDYVEAYYSKGNLLGIYFSRLPEALECYKKALRLKPDLDCLLGDVLLFQRQLAQWDDFRAVYGKYLETITNSPKTLSPFAALSLVDEPELHRRVAECHAAEGYPAVGAWPPIQVYAKHEKIRIGYFSSDFGNHPVTHLLAGVLEQHDRSKFEIFAFAFGAERDDPWRTRVMNAVDHFVDLGIQPAVEIAKLARELEIDIAIDLNGFTTDSRPQIFSERAAPVQASYIGYIGTMGASFIDYLIADRVVIPESSQQFYSEKIVYLSTFQCNDSKQVVSSRAFQRSEFGLPEVGFVFCSFNNTYKITPEVFDIWMRILRRAPGSVLWLYVLHHIAIDNLRRQAEARGVSRERLVFAKALPLEEHLGRQKLADLLLDTRPYNAGATASNALKVGLPILTRVGESFVSRMSASLLQSVGVPELITHTDEEYENLAVELATQPDKHEAIRKKLADNLPSCALFDTERFTRNIEAAYIAMYERSQNGLPPEHIDVFGRN